MRLPVFKRFQHQDYPRKYNDLTETLFSAFNPFLEGISQALSNRLTFAANFACYTVQFEITMPIQAGGFKITNPSGGVYSGAIITNCINKVKASDPIEAAPFMQYTLSGTNQIVIQNITGLTSGKTYVISAVFFR